MTNTPPNGAFRGFGAPQTQFAAEVHMDRIAERLGIDPVRLREINALRPGDMTATGQRLGRDTSALQVLRAAVKRTDFKKKRRAYARTSADRRVRVIGLSLFFHGSGFTAAGGETGVEGVAGTDRARRQNPVASEIGQGTRTMHAQIVADTLGMPYDAVEVNAADTGVVPDSGPTVASRTCMIVGRILQRCADEMRARLGRMTPKEYLRRHGPLVITREYERPTEMAWDDTTYRGDAYGTYGWACDVVELEVDRDTYEARPLVFTTVHEIARRFTRCSRSGRSKAAARRVSVMRCSRKW
jgi:CO/xanthine dehydrogenase Mo-binding subunit